MGSGVLHPAKLAMAVARVKGIPGDFAEIGVYRGQTFRHLVSHARDDGRMAYAFDSFVGMNDPGPLDGEEYPRGQFDAGGPEAFMCSMDAIGIERDWYRIGAGYVPHCFEGFEGVHLALVYLDLDHCEPTRQALDWLWPRMPAGGVLVMDDYMPGKDMLASAAIDAFLFHNACERIGEIENDQLIVVKP